MRSASSSWGVDDEDDEPDADSSAEHICACMVPRWQMKPASGNARCGMTAGTYRAVTGALRARHSAMVGVFISGRTCGRGGLSVKGLSTWSGGCYKVHTSDAAQRPRPTAAQGGRRRRNSSDFPELLQVIEVCTAFWPFPCPAVSLRLKADDRCSASCPVHFSGRKTLLRVETPCRSPSRRPRRPSQQFAR